MIDRVLSPNAERRTISSLTSVSNHVYAVTYLQYQQIQITGLSFAHDHELRAYNDLTKMWQCGEAPWYRETPHATIHGKNGRN
jgi:hypothetical protein